MFIEDYLTKYSIEGRDQYYNRITSYARMTLNELLVTIEEWKSKGINDMKITCYNTSSHHWRKDVDEFLNELNRPEDSSDA